MDSRPGDIRPGAPLTLRASWQLRIVAVLAYGVFAAVLLGVRFSQATVDDPSNAIFFVVVLAAFYLLTAMAFAPRVRANEHGLTVVNPCVTWQIPWPSVRGFLSEGSSFLYVELEDETVVRCWAIQATNLMLMLGRKTRVDGVAEILRPCIGGADPAPDPGWRKTWTRPHWLTWIGGLVVLFTAFSWFSQVYVAA